MVMISSPSKVLSPTYDNQSTHSHDDIIIRAAGWLYSKYNTEEYYTIPPLLRSHCSSTLIQYCSAMCLSSRFLGPIGVNSLVKLVGVTIAGDRPRSGVVGVATGERPA